MFDDLIYLMKDKMLANGELLSDQAAAEFIHDYETARKIRLPLEALRDCVDDASNQYIDSMIRNVLDSELSHEESSRKIAALEVQRPRCGRLRMLERALKNY